MTLEQAKDLLNKACKEAYPFYTWPQGPAAEIHDYQIVTEHDVQDEIWTIATGKNLAGLTGTIVARHPNYRTSTWAALWSNGTTWYHD